MEYVTKSIDLKSRPENLSERLVELGFESRGNERWAKQQITAVEHSRELSGKKFYTLRFNTFECHEDQVKELNRIHELLDREYRHLKID